MAQATVDEPRTERREAKTPLAEKVVPVPLLFSFCAVLISVAALVWTIRHDPLRPHLDRYDFSTPKNCLVSMLEMDVANDIGTGVALQNLLSQRAVEEKLRTIAVQKEAEWKGNKILFVSYEDGGVRKYTTEAFTKDADTGFWTPTYVGSYEVEDDNKGLSTMMVNWREKGRLE